MKILKEGRDARKTLLKGLNTAINITKRSMGGRGRTIMIDTPGNVHNTSDGFTILQSIAMNDKDEDMGVKVALEAADKQVGDCGDGTTSVQVILQALINKGISSINEGSHPVLLRRGMEQASELVIGELKKISTEINRDSDEIFDIAKISAHGDDEIAEVVKNAIGMTNEHSIIRVENSPNAKTSIEKTDGMKIGGGWLSALFVNNPAKKSAEHDNPLIFIYEGKIKNFKELFPLLQKVVETGRALIIMSDSFEGEGLSTFAVNHQQGNLIGAAIDPFGFNREDTRSRMRDLAILTGGRVYSPDEGHKIEDVTIEGLGECDKIVISEKETVFINGKGDDVSIQQRIGELEIQLEDSEGYDKELIKGRLASLSGGIATIYVGGTVEVETKERKDRMDDALGAALSALEEGIVPGGGVSLLQAREVLKGPIKGSCETAKYLAGIFDVLSEGEKEGFEIMYNALEIPFKQIVMNAGQQPDELLDKLKEEKKGAGYDVNKEEFVDMIKGGVLDPTKVEICAVKNATSVATQFLNTDGLICNT
jgi:chaperonin GroEL